MIHPTHRHHNSRSGSPPCHTPHAGSAGHCIGDTHLDRLRGVSVCRSACIVPLSFRPPPLRVKKIVGTRGGGGGGASPKEEAFEIFGLLDPHCRPSFMTHLTTPSQRAVHSQHRQPPAVLMLHSGCCHDGPFFVKNGGLFRNVMGPQHSEVGSAVVVHTRANPNHQSTEMAGPLYHTPPNHQPPLVERNCCRVTTSCCPFITRCCCLSATDVV